MTNTALRAENSNSRTITFKSKEHEKFYMEYLEKCRYQDVYHQALVYCLGIDRDTRENVNKIYNFKTGCVKTESLQEGWQTSGSLRIVRIKKTGLSAGAGPYEQFAAWKKLDSDQAGIDYHIDSYFCPIYDAGTVYGWGIYLLWVKCPV